MNGVADERYPPAASRLCFLFAPGKFYLFGEDFHSGFDFCGSGT